MYLAYNKFAGSY